MSEAKDIFSGIGQSMNGLGGIHSLGILNALKTGDPHVDMIVALCFPFLLTYMLGCLKEFKKYFNKEFWLGWWYGDMAPTVYHERTISHTTHTDAYGDTSSADATSHNSVIIKAIRLYCHAMIDLKLQKADLSLTAMEDKLHSGTQNSYYGQSIVNLLKQYKLVKNPPEKQWHQLGVFGEKKHNESLVEMTRTSNDSNDSEEENKPASKRTERTTYTFRSLDGHAIDTFLGTAYKWYLEQLKQKEDMSRYYYDLEPTTGESNSPRYYKRFRLSEDKTFESLFFREKKPIMKLVDDFMQKRGRYGIKGYPYKLGLLLHGPPGTGKTSLIKALAQHTGRSIVNVPLSKISTNAELMSQLFDKKYRVPGELTVSLDFKDVIFCLEDLDAASDIVRRRDGKSDDGDELIPIDEIPPTKSLWHYFLESSSEACQELVKVLKDKSDKLKQEAQKPDCVAACLDCLTGVRPGLTLATSKNSAMRKLGEDAIKAASDKLCTTGKIDAFLEHQAKKMKRMLDNGVVVDASFVESLLSTDPVSLSSLGASSMTNSSTSDFTDTSSTEESYSYERRPMPPPPTDSGDGNKPSSDSNTKTPYYSSWFRTPDALDLAGLLNALDGVVDCPGRIVVMTSNHPEKLDKALIRPGRIDKKLYLGKMKGLDVMEMLEHYFETELSEVQRQRVESTISDGATEFSPAEIEQMTAEYDDVEGLIAALEEKALAGVGLVPGSPQG